MRGAVVVDESRLKDKSFSGSASAGWSRLEKVAWEKILFQISVSFLVRIPPFSQVQTGSLAQGVGMGLHAVVESCPSGWERLSFQDSATRIASRCSPEHVTLVGLYFNKVDVAAKVREGFMSNWRFVDEFKSLRLPSRC